MAGDFGRVFVMIVGVRFVQESKCPRFTSRSSVDGFGRRRRHVGILTSHVLLWLDGLCCFSVGVLMRR